MYLPALQPVANLDIRICGDVEIHPTASIAPGVILQAAPNSQIIIGIDACIGMGVIISAYGGKVEIANGATIGSGVIIVGCSQVGTNACVGTATTIFNASVDSMAVITPGSIIGDISRSEKATTKSETTANNLIPVEIQENTARDNDVFNSFETNHNHNQNEILEYKSINSINQNAETEKQLSNNSTIEDEASDPWSEKRSTDKKAENKVKPTDKEVEKSLKVDDVSTIGKVYIDQLLVTLFPHKRNFNNNSSSQNK